MLMLLLLCIICSCGIIIIIVFNFKGKTPVMHPAWAKTIMNFFSSQKLFHLYDVEHFATFFHTFC